MTLRKGLLNSPRKNKQSKYHVERAAKAAARRNATYKSPTSGCQVVAECTTNPSGFLGFDVPPLKTSLRVLSLFDGIATALHCLDKLKLKVDVYFSSEVNDDALELQKFLYGDRITMLGSVSTVSMSKLQDLGRIHLLIGGSPCDQLSRVNPRRKGLSDPSSSGALFYDYVRIRNHLREAALKDNFHFYWLFENTFNMEVWTRVQISKHLGCDPVMRNSSEYLPVDRKRLFWGNLPDMAVMKGVQAPVQLNDLLPAYRFANVAKVPTLTTTTHSQRSGKHQRRPVIQEGRETDLFISEIEALFGFPKGYTDGPNLSVTTRRRLLGKSFCVPTIEDLLRPLTSIFWQAGSQ